MQRAAYRIVDANFNRAREALRVMEEVCRFALNDAELSGRAKQLRHELSAAIGAVGRRSAAGRSRHARRRRRRAQGGQPTPAGLAGRCLHGGGQAAARGAAGFGRDDPGREHGHRGRDRAAALRGLYAGEGHRAAGPAGRALRAGAAVRDCHEQPAGRGAGAGQPVCRRRGRLHSVADQGAAGRSTVRPGGRVRGDLPGDGGAEHHQRPGRHRRGGRRRRGPPGPERSADRAGQAIATDALDRRQEHAHGRPRWRGPCRASRRT